MQINGKQARPLGQRYQSALRIVRVFFFLLLFCIQVQARSQSKVSLHIKNGTLESVLKEVRRQTGYYYALQDQWKQEAKKITISVDNVSLEEALNICFKDQPFQYEIVNKTIVIKPKQVAAEPIAPGVAVSIDIHGIVFDENKQPAPGVTVALKGTSRVTVTDDNGEFYFKSAGQDATLVFTSVNLETFELNVKGQTELTINLKAKTKQLGEVSVQYSNGYQSLPKERATGSFDYVSNAKINEQVGTNILDRLDGVASSVYFPKQPLNNSAPTFMIRGLSTINGPKQPLIVVDNFPYDGDINNINPNDVESVTILKDAASASQWGTRAGNGVVVITTKRGKIGQAPKIQFNTDFITAGKPDLGYLKIMNTKDYIDLETYLFNQGYYDPYLTDTYNWSAVSPVVDILSKEQQGLISASDAQAQISALGKNDVREQYKKYFYQKPLTQQYSLSVSGGTNNLAYYLSGGYDKAVDNLAAESDRITVRSENTFKPNKNVQLTVGFQYTHALSYSGKPSYGSVLVNQQWQIPYLQFADQHGNAVPVANLYQTAYTDTAGSGRLLDWKYYPLTDWKHNTVNTTQDDLLGNIGLSIRLFKGLSIEGKYLYEKQTGMSNNLEDMESFAARDAINRYSQVDPSTGKVAYILPKGDILNTSSTNTESQKLRGQINYSNTWGKNSVYAIAGSEINQTRITGNANTIYGYNPDVLTFANVDYVTEYPYYQNGSYNTIPNGLGFVGTLNRYVSYYANGAYTYDQRYTLSISGRRDASNLFGVSTNNKWNPLWSSGIAWKISNEKFYHIKWLSYLNFRSTYGFSGNVDPSKAGITTVSYGAPAFYTNYPTALVSNFANPQLRWEQVKTINFGIDFSALNDRISGSFEVYYKDGKDLFGFVPYDASDGLNLHGTLTKNVANMSGRGVDLTLNSRNIISGKFQWSTALLFSYNNDKTTKYYFDTTALTNNYLNNGNSISPLVGKPLYSISVFKFGGLDNTGAPQGFVDGKLSTDYYTIDYKTPLNELVFKPSLPTYFGSLSNTFSWRDLALTVNISYRLGYYFLRPSFQYGGLFAGGASVGSSDYEKRWQKPGDEMHTNVPAFQYPSSDLSDGFYSNSTALLDKADNVKLQYINLSYTFNKSKISLIGLSSIQLYVNASNLGILWKANHDGLDPDFLNQTPPTPKTFAIGIRASL